MFMHPISMLTLCDAVADEAGLTLAQLAQTPHGSIARSSCRCPVLALAVTPHVPLAR